jgi:hypothetical protein
VSVSVECIARYDCLFVDRCIHYDNNNQLEIGYLERSPLTSCVSGTAVKSNKCIQTGEVVQLFPKDDNLLLRKLPGISITGYILTYPHIPSHILLSVWRLSGKINTKATEQHSDKKAQLQAAELQDTTINVHQELWNGSNFPSKADILMDLLWIYLWISKQLCIPMSTFVPIYSTSGRHVIKRSWVTLRKPHALADLRHQVRRTRR